MPKSSAVRDASRAEARRRARLAARGELPEEVDEPAEAAEAAPRSSLLSRVFPSAPPLPGMPDPLAGYTLEGPFRRVVEPFWILGHESLAWVGPGVLWGGARLLTDNSMVGILASFGGFGSIIAAGWFGWRRPWLYGLMASALGIVIFAAIITWLVSDQETATAIGLPAVFAGVIGTEAVQLLIGVLGGLYGGYFRRRVAATSPPAPSRRRR